MANHVRHLRVSRLFYRNVCDVVDRVQAKAYRTREGVRPA
jgi:hypothetical protein